MHSPVWATVQTTTCPQVASSASNPVGCGCALKVRAPVVVGVAASVHHEAKGVRIGKDSSRKKHAEGIHAVSVTEIMETQCLRLLNDSTIPQHLHSNHGIR